MSRFLTLLVVTIILRLSFGLPVAAQSLFERLVMPGDLIEGHADLQKECDNCHTSFSKGAQVQLCLDCHKEIAKDITDKTGFHGRTTETQASECRHCHTDHIGRDAKIAAFDIETFSHETTDFKLNDSHQSVTCSDCHKEGEKYREAPKHCNDCHKKIEPHEGTLGKDCATCHRETDWTDTLEFDHSKTKFPLEQAHKDVKCYTCHVGEVYVELPLTCIGCHRIQDVHENRFDDKCEKCHKPNKWTDVRFDHDKDTDFTLLGKHQEVDCISCHKVNAYQHDTGSSCNDCHSQDDVHETKLGTDCKTCHSSDGWFENVSFDHGITNFPLIGLHVLVPCEECHADSTFQNTKLDCKSCHQASDIHKETMGSQCETCHNPNGWEFWIFDHNRQTDFQLTGSHIGLKCETCHTPARANNLQLPTTCVACHKNDDKHSGQFGTNCSRCHNTQSFKGAKLQ